MAFSWVSLFGHCQVTIINQVVQRCALGAEGGMHAATIGTIAVISVILTLSSFCTCRE